MEAQEFEQTLNAYFRLRQAEIAALTAPSWFEHELRRSAFLAERAEASLCDPLALAELTDMSGGLLAEETPASVSAQSVASQAPIVRRIAPFFGRQRKERPKKADTGRRWAWIGSFAVAAVVFMMVYAALAEIDDLPDSFSGTVTIAAVADNGAGISMEQGFVITAEQPLTEDLVRQSLSIAPATDYQLRAEDQGKTMIITPDAPLVGGTIYQLTFDPERYLDDLPERAAYTWAFQTEEPFAVLQTLPADMSTWVPVETAITVDFNQEVDVESAAKAIVIKPEIAGSWQGEGKHLTFMADQSLAYDTVYEVYLGEELHSAADIPLGEATMLRFETISQQGAEQQGAASDLTISNDESNFSPAAIPWITFYDATRSASVAEMQVKVYGFKDAQAYAAALAARSSEYFWTDNAGVIQLDSKDLPLVEEFSALPQSVTNHSFCYQIKFPQPLPAGYYLAKLVAGSQNYQMLFSVSTLSAYIAQGEQDVLFWLNCGQQAADEAVITAYYGSKQVKTDQNGIAVLDMAEAAHPRNIYVMRRQGADLVAVTNQYADVKENRQQNLSRFHYWHYLYLDRNLYRSGETAEVFGVIAPKEQQPAPKTVTLQLKGGEYGEDFAVLTWDFPVVEDVFSGQLKLPQLQEGWYYLEMTADDVVMEQVYFQVDDYHTASYRLTVVPERPAVMVGEPISWQVQATYFDGTAAAGIALAQKSGEGQTQPFTTDQNGAAVMETVADNFYQESGYILTSANGDVIADLPEGGQVEASAYCDVFLNDQDISGDFTREQKQYQLKLNAHDIVLDDLQDYEDREQLLDQAYRDITTPVTLNASLIHIGYQPQMRSYFDEYTQQTVEYTDYESFEELESSFTVTLADSAEHLFDGVLATGDSYRMELRGLDKAGRAVERNFYLWSAEDVGSSLWLQTYREQEDGLYQIGENISLAVQSGADNAPLTMAERSKMLFFCSKNEIVDYEISGDNHFERIFTGTDSPNLNISAVYFADGVYHSTYCYRAALDPAAYTGTVSITADQRSYAPGEAVHLDISCTDPQGKPFAGWVNVCVVDEKLLQIKENYANITTQLFDDLIPYGYTDFSLNANTEKDAQVLNAGGKGDGSGGLGDTRDDFRDMAVCATLKTDVNGEAKLEFTLPDDITGWRVTAQAYGTGPVVAYRQVGLSATLPFFGELRLGDVFRVGDSPHIGLRAAGSDVQATAPVTYSISIPELNFSAKAEGRAADWTEIALPILTAGEYTVAMTAASGLHTDRQTRHFTVTDTLATHVVHDCYGVEPGLTIAKTGAEITTLVFTDSQNAQNIASLLDLAGQDSVRLEQCLAALYARQALTELWGENGHGITQLQINEAQLNRLADYQQQDGGLSSFPYGDSDIFTSALAAVLGAQYFDQRALTLYFEHYLSEGCGRQEQAMAYWGLAALRQPVLQDITALLKQDNDAISQVYLALALVSLGNGATAAPLAESLCQQYTEPIGEVARAKTASANLVQDTVSLALLASFFDLPIKDALFAYVEQNYPTDEYYLLQRALILKQRLLNTAGGAASFTYTLSGAKTSVDLRQEKNFVISLTEEQLKEFRIDSCQGAVQLTACYQQAGLPAANGQGEDWGLTVSREYNQHAGDQVLDQRGLVRVDLSYSIPAEAPAGAYMIVDYLPAALRFTTVLPQDDQEGQATPWLTEEQGARLVFSVDKPAGMSLSGQVSYQARISDSGSFIAEAPYLYPSCSLDSLVTGQVTHLTIK